MKPGGPDLHVSVFGPGRVLVYAQTYKASQVVKALGDQRLMSVKELVALIEALAPPCGGVDLAASVIEQHEAAERATSALIERLRQRGLRPPRSPAPRSKDSRGPRRPRGG
jgi:hypothetical protein